MTLSTKTNYNPLWYINVALCSGYKIQYADMGKNTGFPRLRHICTNKYLTVSAASRNTIHKLLWHSITIIQYMYILHTQMQL